MSDTPETDKLISDWYCNLTGLPNFVDIARKFERERDEAIELLKYASTYSTTKSQEDTYKFLRKINKLEEVK